MNKKQKLKSNSAFVFPEKGIYLVNQKALLYSGYTSKTWRIPAIE